MKARKKPKRPNPASAYQPGPPGTGYGNSSRLAALRSVYGGSFEEFAHQLRWIALSQRACTPMREIGRASLLRSAELKWVDQVLSAYGRKSPEKSHSTMNCEARKSSALLLARIK